MRWYVEVSRVDETAAHDNFCVEAQQWQGALQEARKLRGDVGPLSKFSIEMTSDGYRAVDPKARIRYVVNKAPSDAPLNNGSSNGAASQAPHTEPMATAPLSTLPASALASKAPPGAFPAVEGPAPAPELRPSSPPRPASAPASLPAESTRPTQPSLPAAAIPDFDVVRKRVEEPSEDSPIVYREFVYAVKPDTPVEAAELLLWARLRDLQSSLEGRPAGKYVQLAVFDHSFEKRPTRPPLATLAWKDWRGEPVITRPEATRAPSAAPPGPPPSLPASAVPEAAPHADAAEPAPRKDSPPSVEVEIDVPVDVELPVDAPKPRLVLAPLPDAVARHKKGEDLIGELFERMHELHFMPDVVAGTDFVRRVLVNTLPCEAALLHVFDINSRQFVVVRSGGRADPAVVLHKTPDKFPLFDFALRRHGTVHVKNAANDERYQGGRWDVANVIPLDALCGPVHQGGRYLGIIELVNPPGDPFYESEINALDYICEQFAEFLANRPIVLDADVIRR